MAQVIRPQTKSDLGEVLTLGGAIAGGVLGSAGGPAGAAGGAALGGGLGGMASNMLEPPKPQESPLQGGGESAAMLRRQQQMSQDSLGTLKAAEAQLPNLPESLRQQYAPAIVQARMMEQQKRGLA